MIPPHDAMTTLSGLMRFGHTVFGYRFLAAKRETKVSFGSVGKILYFSEVKSNG
jgi:hypothetical protein